MNTLAYRAYLHLEKFDTDFVNHNCNIIWKKIICFKLYTSPINVLEFMDL